VLWLYKNKQNFIKFADAAAQSIILAQGLELWGNFFV